MIIKAQCPKCKGRGAKAFEIKVDLPLSCAVRHCERAGQIEVEVSSLTFWMCLIHASGKEISKYKECICSDDGKIMCEEHYEERYPTE